AAHDLFQLEFVEHKSVGERNLVFKLHSNDDAETPENKKVILDESSPIFNNLRHVFFVQAIEEVAAKIKELSEFTTPETDIAKLAERVHKANDHLALKEQLSRAQDLLQQMVDKVKEITDYVKVEQDLMTGANVDGVLIAGNRAKFVTRLKELFELLVDDDDKWRVLLLFVLAFGKINEQDFQDLLASANLQESYYPIFRGFSFFGYELTSAPGSSSSLIQNSKRSSIAWKSFFGLKPNEQSAERRAAQEKQFSELNPNEFRTVRDAKLEAEEGARKVSGSMTIKRTADGIEKPGEGVLLDFKETHFAPKWGRARPKPPAHLGGDYRDNGPKTVVIVLGGLTYAEVRECYLAGLQNERESPATPLNVLEAALPEKATRELTTEPPKPETIKRRQTSAPNLVGSASSPTSSAFVPGKDAPLPTCNQPAGFTTQPYPGPSGGFAAQSTPPSSRSANQLQEDGMYNPVPRLPTAQLQQQHQALYNAPKPLPTSAGRSSKLPPTPTNEPPSFVPAAPYTGHQPPAQSQTHPTYALPPCLEAEVARAEAKRLAELVPPPPGDKPIVTFTPFQIENVNVETMSNSDSNQHVNATASVPPPRTPVPVVAAPTPALASTGMLAYQEQQKIRQQMRLKEQERLEQEDAGRLKREEQERLQKQQQEQERLEDGEFERQKQEEEQQQCLPSPQPSVHAAERGSPINTDPLTATPNFTSSSQPSS
ncbi:UNVERIFIED_CONTAM: Syntaxin-binding protein 3, partial [Siphonaria sp. JEL0065]